MNNTVKRESRVKFLLLSMQNGERSVCEWFALLKRKCCHLRRSHFLAGFTLIELILVLVIIGFLTALVTPAITSLTGLKLRTAGRRIAAGLRYARSQAVTTGSEYQVVFNLGKGEMHIRCSEEKEERSYYQDIEGEHPQDEEQEDLGEEMRLPKREPREKVYTLPEEIKLAKVIIDGEEIVGEEEEVEQSKIDFYPNGSCSGGEIYLSDNGEKGYRISLDFLTSMVTINEIEEFLDV